MMMMIAPDSRARKGGEVKGEYRGIGGEEEGNADYGCNPVFSISVFSGP